MLRSYEAIKLRGLENYPPFPYPEMPEEERYDWGLYTETMTWVYVGFPE